MQAIIARAESSCGDSPGAVWGAGLSTLGGEPTFPSSCLYNSSLLGMSPIPWHCTRCRSAHFSWDSKTALVGGLCDDARMWTRVGTGGSKSHPDLFLSPPQCMWLGPRDVPWYSPAPSPLAWRQARPMARHRAAALEIVSVITDFLMSRKQKEMCILFYELPFLSCWAGNTCIELGRHSHKPSHLTLSLQFPNSSCRSQSNSVEKKPEKLASSTGLYGSDAAPPAPIPPPHITAQGGEVPSWSRWCKRRAWSKLGLHPHPQHSNPHTVTSMVRRTRTLGKQLAQFPSMEEEEEKDHLIYRVFATPYWVLTGIL